MSGIYIHIPFCRKACHYCDFHFSTSLKNKNAFLDSLKKEIELQKDYFKTNSENEIIESVYLGGGTPSILSKAELLSIFDVLNTHFQIDSQAEITLEANPDDLSKEKITELFQTQINRLSIGIQSFSNADLKFLNRIHTSEDAITSVKKSQDAGFSNITIDLIYGIQTLTNNQWERNLETAFSLGVHHISSYCLTIEPKTALYRFISSGKIQHIDESKGAEQFEILMDRMEAKNFIHYEISNFGKENYFSKHNSNYWKRKKYLGIGPSAHSFDGETRQWNVSSNTAYIQSISEQKIPSEKEILSQSQKFNEYILTSLRTMWGIDLSYVKQTFSSEIYSTLLNSVKKIQKVGQVNQNNNHVVLTKTGKLFADKIASDLFVHS